MELITFSCRYTLIIFYAESDTTILYIRIA